MALDNQRIYFLHGLESSGNGTKGRFFAEHFPQIRRPDFHGSLAVRLQQLESLCNGEKEITFIGSSFGGLMATFFAEKNRDRVARLILFAPALNFEAYTPPKQPLNIPTFLIIGTDDDVTPMDPVLDLARKTFTQLTVWTSDDDHMLHKCFPLIDWEKLLDVTIKASQQPLPPYCSSFSFKTGSAE